MYRFSRALAFAGLLAFAANCAQSNGDLNRVQPNVTKKADLLDGVWYFRNTVTYTPATTGFTYTGETGTLEKIVFDVTMDNLIGYRSYPYIPGSDRTVDPNSVPSGTTAIIIDKDGNKHGGQKYYGAPLVMFSIQSHFDIQRNYNPATGEQGNVIQENSTDRPWYQREFMRVNWAINKLNQGGQMGWSLLDNPSGKTCTTVYDPSLSNPFSTGCQGTDLSSWIQPNEPGTDPYDWPSQEFDKDGKLTYFDWTGRYMAIPDLTYYDGYGWVPKCYLSYHYDCASQEIHMRTSIAKVDPNATDDYEPLVYSNDMMVKFGYFRTERLNYDRKFGNTESARILLANRHNIWKRSHELDANGHPDLAKPIPPANREVKPIVYYLTRSDRLQGGQEYKDILIAARELEKNWNVAFKRAVAAAQGKDVNTLDAIPQMLYICENPVPAVDTLTGQPVSPDVIANCGPVGFSARFGDLRKSFASSIAEPVPNGLLGYGPSGSDPETGEIIAANANTYTGAVDYVAQSILDTIDVLSGARNLDDIIRGTDVKEYMASHPGYGMSNNRQLPAGGQLQAAEQGTVQTSDPTSGAFDRPTQRMASKLSMMRATGGLPLLVNDPVKAATDKLEQNPALEALILDNPDVANDIVGLLPDAFQQRAATDADFRRAASRRVLTHFGDAMAEQRQKIDFFSTHNITTTDMAYSDEAMLGLANRLSNQRAIRINELETSNQVACNNQPCAPDQAKEIANEELRHYLRQKVWQSTAEHEIGHTFGLRHNFQGSFDAVNYFDDYWTLKKDGLTVQQGGVAKVPRTPADLKTISDATELQLAAGVHDYEYSSIMDYSGKRNGDWYGPGKYDNAAILFAYSGTTEPGYVEVFNGARASDATFPGSDGKQVQVTSATYDLPVVNAAHLHQGVPNYSERYHYTQVPLHFGNGTTTDAAVLDGILKLRDRRLVKWSTLEAQNARLRQVMQFNPNPSKADVGSNALMEVPYMFCTDDHVGSVLSCNRFDRGPDYYEIARTAIESYWSGYFFNHFRRDRFAFGSSNALNSAWNTFDELANIYRHWVFEFYGKTAADQQNLTRYLTGPFALDPSMQDTWTMAVMDGANANLAVFSVPPAGMYMYRNGANAQDQMIRGQLYKYPKNWAQWDVISEGDDFDDLTPAGQKLLKDYYGNSNYWDPPATAFTVMKRGDARRMYSRYDFKSGADFWYRMLEAGHYNDQIGAMIGAIIPYLSVLGADDIADQNRYNVPYWLTFDQEFGSIFSSLWTYNDYTIFPTMYLTKDSLGNVTSSPALAFQQPVQGANFVQNFNWPPQLSSTFDPKQNAAPASIQYTWTARIYAIWLGMAYFSVNFDFGYAKSNQVFKLGNGEQVTVAPNYHAFEVNDVTSGARYEAMEKDSDCDPSVANTIDRPLSCDLNDSDLQKRAACQQLHALCPNPYSTPAVRMVAIARDYLKVVQDPTICPMPTFGGPLWSRPACMPDDQVTNPALIEKQRRTWTVNFQDAIRDLDIMRGFYVIFGKAF